MITVTVKTSREHLPEITYRGSSIELSFDSYWDIKIVHPDGRRERMPIYPDIQSLKIEEKDQ